MAGLTPVLGAWLQRGEFFGADLEVAAQAAEQIAAGRKWGNADRLIFTTAEGRPLHPNTARYVLDELCARARGVPRLRR